jgi:hypothetical protein
MHPIFLYGCTTYIISTYPEPPLQAAHGYSSDHMSIHGCTTYISTYPGPPLQEQKTMPGVDPELEPTSGKTEVEWMAARKNLRDLMTNQTARQDTRKRQSLEMFGSTGERNLTWWLRHIPPVACSVRPPHKSKRIHPTVTSKVTTKYRTSMQRQRHQPRSHKVGFSRRGHRRS